MKPTSRISSSLLIALGCLTCLFGWPACSSCRGLSSEKQHASAGELLDEALKNGRYETEAELEATGQGGKLHAEAALTIEKNALTVTYAIENESDNRVCVFNKLLTAEGNDGPVVTRPNLVYVSRNPDGSVTITKRLIGQPPGKKFEYAEVPLLSCIEPSGTIRESFSLHMPLELRGPYVDPYHQAKDRENAVIDSVRLTLGYIVPSDKVWVKKTTIGTQRAFKTDYGLGKSAQELLDFDPARIPVVVQLPK